MGRGVMKNDFQPGDIVRFTEQGCDRSGRVKRVGYKHVCVEVATPWTLLNQKFSIKKFKPEQLKKEGER